MAMFLLEVVSTSGQSAPLFLKTPRECIYLMVPIHSSNNLWYRVKYHNAQQRRPNKFPLIKRKFHSDSFFPHQELLVRRADSCENASLINRILNLLVNFFLGGGADITRTTHIDKPFFICSM